MSKQPGDGNRDRGRPLRRGEWGSRSNGPPAGGRPAGARSQPARAHPRRGPIGLMRVGTQGDDFELVHPRIVEETRLDYEEGIELWKEGDFESARDALRFALSACHENLWVHVALGQIALAESRDPALARGHFGYAIELVERALPRGFAGRLARERPSNRPFYDAVEGLVECLEALGRHGDSARLRRSGIGFPPAGDEAEWGIGCAGLRRAQKTQRVARQTVFSTLGVFRTCRDSRIGIERPQNGAHKPEEWHGTRVSCNLPAGRKRNVEEHGWRGGCARVMLGVLVPPGGSPAVLDAVLGSGLMIIRSIVGGVEALAPAKLNLFLEVLGRRTDGYHEIESLMVAVSLYDSLTFTDDPSGELSLRCNEPTLPVGGDNLVVIAADRLRRSANSLRERGSC